MENSFVLVFFIGLLSLSNFTKSSIAADTITPKETITHPKAIISAGGRFELGFFSLKNDTSYYLGIWYREVSPQTVVWVANREYPILSSSASLSIGSDGNIVIFDSKMNYSVTNTASSCNTYGTLVDSGNLVLMDRDQNLQVLWQSFDYPIDTLLPGMKLGYDGLTNISWSLVSWKNSQDPAPGVFSLVLDFDDLIIKNGSKIYWSGDKGLFNLSFSTDYYGSSYVTLADELKYRRVVLDVSGQLKLQSWTEGVQGWYTLEASTCGISGCGSFSICNKNAQMPCVCLPGFSSSESNDSSAQEPHETWAVGARRCVRKTVLGCSSNSSSRQDEDGFLTIENADFPINPLKLDVKSSMECESASLSNCSWIAYAFDERNGSCLVWDNELLNLKKLIQGDSNGRNFFLKLAASELNSHESDPSNGTLADPAYQKNTGNKKQLLIIVILTISLTVVTTLSFVMLCVRGKLKRKGKLIFLISMILSVNNNILALINFIFLHHTREDLLLFDLGTSPKADSAELTEENQLGKSRKNEVKLPLFSFASVSAATDNFSAANKLGEGGFGPVYKGTLLKGDEIAVKRLSRRSGQGWEELKNEAQLIANLQHKNLVRLFGCCIEKDEKILIYEYMPNKSLDCFLFDPTKRRLLDWGTRVRIIEGIAQGLLYLHQYSRLRIIHRDLKASNILLDTDMNPKISDFGMARIFGGNESQANTNRIVGTYGYMSPEYVIEGIFSIKSDVFSFGVLLLEIVSGKKNTGFYQTASLNLLGYFSVVAVTDSISQGRVVTRSETIVSAGKVFELGFFTIGNSSNYYVGIWYKQISVKTIVWVANRDLPLTSSSPALTINSEGNLVIVVGRITYEVSDNALSQNTSAILLDSGNFVLRNENFDVLWQSFDYPSDTLLPGMKLGYSTRNKKLWSIRSWRDVDDPEVGAAELKMDPKRPKELFLIRNSELAWQSDGAWREGRFNLMPEMISNYTFNYSFYTNENETYFIYFLYNSSIPSRFLIDVSGQLKQLLWLEKNQIWGLFWAQPRYECDIYSHCGPFSSCSKYTESFCHCLDGFIPSGNWKQKDQSGGCVRRIPLRCEDSSDNSGKDRFRRIDEVKFPLSPKTSKVHAADECNLACFNSCSCNAYAYNGSGVCYLWDAELLNLEQLSDGHPDGQTIYLKLAASEFLNPGGNKQLIWIVAVVVSLAVLLPASYIFCRWRTKRKAKEEIEISQDMLLFDMNMSVETSTSELSIGDGAGKGKSKDSWFPLFSLASVSAATDNFSAENKLGEGGFGPVYKGKLLNRQEVAVKRLSRQSGQGLEELKNETMLIAKLQHRNLVRLLGCCMEHGEKILIYEYMPNKSLDSFLFDPIKKGLLDWGTRVKIIEGIAQGVLYLHQYSRLRIIHRDLKASNILLDSFMNPKISDFGMARMFGGDELQASTNRIVGTYGYMSPEYALEGLFSIKSDVFSFGVLLLETLSGRKNTGFYNTESLNLLGHAWKLWKDNKAIDLLDPILKDEASYPMLMRCINIAFLCVEENAADRPTMSEVVSMLTNELVVLSSPKQLAFSFMRMQNSNPHQERLEICSLNNITVSLMEAR